MKRVRFLIIPLLAVLTMPVWSGNVIEKDTDNKPEITFEETTHDFGLFDKAHGDKVVWFVFKNTGNKELFILSANSTCGCTVPEYPKTAILPGMKDSIKVSYNGSTKRVGKMRKAVVLTTNCSTDTIYITGEMVEELVADRIKPEEQK